MLLRPKIHESFYRNCLTPNDPDFEQGTDLVQLKEGLVAKATLTPPDCTLPIKIQSDASKCGIGAVVVQRSIENGKKPFQHLRAYKLTEKKCLAVDWAIKKFQYLIQGCELLKVTNHDDLCRLMSKKDLA